MLQHTSQIRGDGPEPLQGDPEFAVIQRAGPGGGLGDVKESLVGVQNDLNAGSRLDPELAGQFFVLRLQSCENLAAKCLRALSAFVAQNKVPSFALGVIALGGSFAFSPG